MDRGRSAKALIKRATKQFAMVAGRFARASGVRILTYHSVGMRDHEMNVPPGEFRVQMEWLADHAAVLPLDAAVDSAQGVAITFDDGYLDNVVHAAPILRDLELPATFFVVPGRFGQILDHDWDEVTSALMNWDDVFALEQMGFSIGGHTMTHPRLSRLSVDGQRAEIAGCADMLRERLGHPVTSFAYPFGSEEDYDEDSVRLVREAGFRIGLSNRYGVNGPDRDPWALRRIWIDATDTLATFRAKVDGRLDILRLLDAPGVIKARRALNRFLRVD